MGIENLIKGEPDWHLKINNNFNESKNDLTDRGINIMYPPAPLVGVVDNGTDQSTVIQAIIDSMTNGGTIFIPKGTFIASFKISSNIKIIGENKYLSILKLPDGKNYSLIDTKSHVNGETTNISIENITIDGNGSTQNPVSGTVSGVYLRGVDGFNISNCRFLNCYSNHIYTGFCKNGLIIDNYMDTTLTSCGISIGGDGVTFVGNIDIIRNTIVKSSYDAIIVNNPYVKIVENYIENSGFLNPAAQIFITNTAKDCKVINNIIINGASIGIDVPGAKDIEIIGNTCKNNGKGGIWVYDSAKGIKIIGNTCVNNNQKNVDMYGGIGINDSTGTAKVTRCVVVNNVCYDDQTTPTQLKGIVSANADYNLIRNNICYNHQTNYYFGDNEHSTIDILSDSNYSLRNSLTVDISKLTGVSGRNIINLNGSSDNTYLQITSNQPRVKLTDNSGKSIAWQHAWWGGSTGSRPTNPGLYEPYFDSTLGKPIWYNGTVWKDSTGTTV